MQISLSNSGRLLLLEMARTDAVCALDEVTHGNQSLRVIQRLLAKPGSQSVEAGSLMLPRILRHALRAGAEHSLLVCVGEG